LSKQSLSSILFWSIASLSAVLLVFLLLLLGGVVPVETPGEPAATEPIAAPPATTTTTSEPPSAPTATRVQTTAPAAQAVVVVTAARGASWFSARIGSENGRVLDERVLAQGESATLRATRIWLSVGASGNVDVTVDGEPTTLPPGTVSVVLAPTRTEDA
jgi:hypothetical protein